MIFDIVNLDYFDLIVFMFLKFEISKVYKNRLQRYMKKKIRVCGKGSIPFLPCPLYLELYTI